MLILINSEGLGLNRAGTQTQTPATGQSRHVTPPVAARQWRPSCESGQEEFGCALAMLLVTKSVLPQLGCANAVGGIRVFGV